MGSAVIGMDQIHYAVLTADDGTSITYDTIKTIPGAVSAKITTNVNSATNYGDDGPLETASVTTGITVDIQVADLPMEARADLLGNTLSTTDGTLTEKGTDLAPYVAFGFRSRKANGKYRYVWLVKGRFTPPEDDYQTKNDNITFQNPSISGTFVARLTDNVLRVMGDEDTTGFTGGSTWFDKVPGDTSGSA
ncbi:MAG: phage tail protein [Alicyclobacillus sp.]|nr:phage tail protein [Alicyclobacillus sp.]